jgi:hypothetical protein
MPTRSAGRIHSCGQASGKKDERHDHQTDKRTDYKAQDNGKLILVLPESFQESLEFGSKT